MYFKLFPKTFYTFNYKENSSVVATDIFSRFKFRESALNNALTFYKYQVTDGETAEIIAHKVYDDSRFHWIICMVNDIIDPQFELPLSMQSLEKNIIRKYGYSTIEQSMSAVHHSEQKIDYLYTSVDGFTTESSEKYEVSTEQYDYSTNTISEIVLNTPVTEQVILRANNSDINSQTIYTISKTTTYKEVSVYDYEVEQNEKNRWIKILKRQYIPMLMNEMEARHYG